MARYLDAILKFIDDYIVRQQDQERDRRWSFWLSVVTTISAVGATLLAFYAFRETQRQTYSLQQQLDEQRAEDRPWIKAIAKVEGDFSYVPGAGGHVLISVTATNVGKSPAFYVSSQLRTAPITHVYRDVDAMAELRDLCDEDYARAFVLSPQSHAWVTFPSDSVPLESQSVGNDDTPIDEGYTTGPRKPPGRALFYVYGCAYYAYDNGGNRTYHHSGFLYVLGQRRHDEDWPGPLPVYQKTAQTVAQAQLELMQMPVGSDVTN